MEMERMLGMTVLTLPSLLWMLASASPQTPEISIAGAFERAQEMSLEDRDYLKRSLGMNARELAALEQLRAEAMRELVGGSGAAETWSKYGDLERRTSKLLGKARYSKFVAYRQGKIERSLAPAPEEIALLLPQLRDRSSACPVGDLRDYFRPSMCGL